MACNNYTFNGIAVQCKDSIGGVVKVWVSRSDDAKITINTSNVADVTYVSSASVSSLSDAFKVFNLRKNSASMVSTLNVSENAGNSFSTEVNMSFLKMETAKRLEMMGLFMNETRVIVKDRNGKYWALGADAGVEASAGTGETGTAATDGNLYSVTLKDDSVELPAEITDTTVIAALEAIVVA